MVLINLLLEFITLHKPNEELLLRVNESYLLKIFSTSVAQEQVKMLLNTLPYKHSINICYNLLKLLKNLDSLQFVVDYLLNNVTNDLLKNVQISLKMLSAFTQSEQEQLLCLIYKPINIIETLVMNTKLEKLSTVLNILKSEISHTECNENKLCIEKIDEVLRNYAEKSLDFRVITQPNPRLLKNPRMQINAVYRFIIFGYKW
ncbi:hypothetical protein NQ314_004709 [Rhamnusium bicolor]|uniref:Uncharacterized protein n=1 Tax=Rhamnusium bicolor TaxID=1586634 RepID=A0AAV8ZLX1_9CUCU|nr:hypothetical protein NQ314_004709 [Rhamnusium bicolor]